MKKLISIVLSFAMILTMCAYPAYAETTSEGVINEAWSSDVSVSFDKSTGTLNILNNGTSYASIYSDSVVTSINISEVKKININKFTCSDYWWKYFKNCEEINITSDSGHFMSENGVVFSRNKTDIIAYPPAKNKGGSYTVPSETTGVEEYAFYNSQLNTLVFSGELSYMAPLAQMPNLTTLVFQQPFSSNSVLNGGDLWGLNNLESIQIAESEQYYTLDSGILYNSDKSILIKCPAKKPVGTFTVPDEVTTIDAYAFEHTDISSISLSENVIKIGYGAFRGCASITSMAIPASVSYVGGNAFVNCSVSEMSFGSGKALDAVGACGSNTITGVVSIDVPDDLTNVKRDTFRAFKNLESVNFSENTKLTAISDYGFSNRKKLNRIEIPEAVVSIGEYAFWSCSSLESVTFKCIDSTKELPKLSIGEGAFGYTAITDLVLPKQTTYIGPHAFQSCYNLKTVTIEEGNADKWTTSIKVHAFSSNYNLETFTANGHVVSIENYAFYNDSKLRSFDAGQTLEKSEGKIGYAAFLSCSSLATMKIPDTVTSIGWWAFSDCEALKTIDIPANVESIGNNSFRNSGIETVTGMEGVTSIGLNSFYFCSSLSSININNGVLSEIKARAFSHVDSIKTLQLPSTVRFLGYHAMNINNLKVNITPDENNKLPETYFAFSKTSVITYPCTADKSSFVSRGYLLPVHNYNSSGICMNCGASVKDIVEVDYPRYQDNPDRDFTEYMYPIDAAKMQYIVIKVYSDHAVVKGLVYNDVAPVAVSVPDTINGIPVTEIMPKAFKDESSLKTLTLGHNLMLIGENALNGTGLTSITLPINCKVDAADTVSESLTEYTYIEGTAFIDYDSITHKDTPWYKNRNNITGITIAEGVTAIPAYMFADMKIKELDIPESVNKVGDNAFYRNYELTKVTGAEGLENIGYEAFADCEALKSMPLSSTITKIRYNSFAGCEALVAIVESGSYAQEAAKKYGIGYKVGVIGAPVIDNSDADISVKSVYAQPGETVTVDIKMNNNPGIASLILNIDYDKTALTLTRIENGTAISSGFVSDDTLSTANVAWDNSDRKDNIVSNGTLVRLTFSVNSDSAGRYEIKATCKDARDKDANYVDFSTASGMVAVSAYTCGDVNRDGLTDNSDAIYILRHLLGFAGFDSFDEVAADVNLDGDVNLADIMAITRAKAGWDGYSLPYVS